jgi:hypothetical protein
MARFNNPSQVTKIRAAIICTEATWRFFQMNLLLNRPLLVLLLLLLLLLLFRGYKARNQI